MITTSLLLRTGGSVNKTGHLISYSEIELHIVLVSDYHLSTENPTKYLKKYFTNIYRKLFRLIFTYVGDGRLLLQFAALIKFVCSNGSLPN